MITWVTVWVLTVSQYKGDGYQLTYATQKACIHQMKKHKKERYFDVRCDFQQIPVVVK